VYQADSFHFLPGIARFQEKHLKVFSQQCGNSSVELKHNSSLSPSMDVVGHEVSKQGALKCRQNLPVSIATLAQKYQCMKNVLDTGIPMFLEKDVPVGRVNQRKFLLLFHYQIF
jgi:hypothetical protein